MQRKRISRYSFYIATIFLMLFTILSILILTTPISKANNPEVANASVNVTLACTMSAAAGTGGTATADGYSYARTIAPGNTTTIDGSILTTTCNSPGNYSLYAIGYSGSSYDTPTNNQLISSNPNASNIATGTATSGSTSNWAFKLDTVSGYSSPTIVSPYSSFSNIPGDDFTKVATMLGTTGLATTTKVQPKYRVYISSNQAAATYTGKVKYRMVYPNDAAAPLSPQPAVARHIVYHANANNVVGSMGNQSATDGNTIMLYTSNFSRTGYGFAGWSDAFDYTTNNNAHFYGPNETITVPTGTTANGLSLYAVWIPSAGTFQSNASSICSALTQAPADGTATMDSISALTDERDNQTYAIAKLADGNCWMIENLRLENTALHNSDGALAQGYGTSVSYGSFIGLASPEFENFGTTTANSLYYSGNPEGTATMNIKDTDDPAHRMPRYTNPNTSDRQSAQNYSIDGNTYSMGNYYTWAAATADTSDYGGRVPRTTSICPSGWMLPYGYSIADKSFGKLSISLGGPVPTSSDVQEAWANSSSTPTGAVMSGRFRSFPNNFIYSGVSIGSMHDERGTGGYYWASTDGTSVHAYLLIITGSLANAGESYVEKVVPASIRCLMNN